MACLQLPAPTLQLPGGPAGSFPVGWDEATGQTVGAVNVDLASVDLADDTAYAVEASFVAFDSTTPKAIAYQRIGCVYRSGGGNAAHASGSPLDQADIDGGGATDAEIRVTGSDGKVYFRVTGEAAKTYDWRCWYRLTPHS